PTYLKVRDRQSYEFALSSAAIALDVQDGTIRDARVALGGVATIPWRARGGGPAQGPEVRRRDRIAGRRSGVQGRHQPQTQRLQDRARQAGRFARASVSRHDGDLTCRSPRRSRRPTW